MRSTRHASRPGLPGYTWAILIAWVAAIIIGAVFAPRLEQVVKAGTALTPGSDSAAAQERIDAEWQNGESQQLILVVTSDALAVEDERYRAAVRPVVDRVRQVAGVTRVSTYWDGRDARMVGQDGRTTLMAVEVAADASEVQRRVVPAVRQAIADAGTGLRILVTGEPAVFADLSQEGLQAISRAETIVIPTVLVVLAIIFGSLVAAVLPLGLGLISVMVSTGLFYLYALHNPVDDSTSAIISMLGMGVGVDYSLFMVTRFREELARGLDRGAAVRRTLATSGKAIVFSGATVIASVAGLYVIHNPLIRAMALAMVLVVLVAVLAATSLLPIGLYALGHRVSALRIPFFGRGRQTGFWHRWAMGIMRRPWLFVALTVLPLAALSYPGLTVKTGMPNLSMLPAHAESRQGFEVVQQQFDAGLTAPLDLLVQVKSGTVADEANLPRFYALVEELRRDPAVAAVYSHVSLHDGWDLARYREIYIDAPAGMAALAGRLQATGGEAAGVDLTPALTRGDFGLRLLMAAGGQEAEQAISAMVNMERGANVARITVVPKEGSDAPATRELVRRLRASTLPQYAGDFRQMLLGGGPAQLVDYSDQMRASMPVVIGVVLAITFVVLLVLLRSLLLPLKAILMNGLSVTAAYGALALVFERGYGAGLLGFTPLGFVETPVIVLLFAVLFGLSMDYEVFLLSRVKEEHDRTGLGEEAVAAGLEQTASVITGAAAIMVVVFSAFVATGMIFVKEFGFGLAVAVFLDASLIRILLAPAFMRLMGDWNWWAPGWLLQVLPRVEVRH